MEACWLLSSQCFRLRDHFWSGGRYSICLPRPQHIRIPWNCSAICNLDPVLCFCGMANFPSTCVIDQKLSRSQILGLLGSRYRSRSNCLPRRRGVCACDQGDRLEELHSWISNTGVLYGLRLFKLPSLSSFRESSAGGRLTGNTECMVRRPVASERWR
jgi:hypothetical protein